MNLTFLLSRPARWLNLPGALLCALLQRTPALPVATTAAEFVAASPIGQVLRATALAAASLGAMHSMAGATQFVASRNPVTGTVGTPITTVTFTVTGAQTPPASFRVMSGSLPPGLTITGLNPTTNIVNAQIPSITGTPTAAGSYSILLRAYEFTDARGDSWPGTAGSTLSFTITGSATSAPAFTTQPVSQTVNAGASVTFSAAASGSPAPTFQWSRNNTVIAGATSATLTLPNVQAADAGSYTVTATNSVSSVVSNAATLTVTAAVVAPAFTVQPTAQTTMPIGSTAVLSVVAPTATSFQWKFNGSSIVNATNAMLILSGLSAAQAGAYSCVASNAGGSTTSNTATLTVGDFSAAATGHLVNVSILTTAGAGSKALTVGAVIGPPGFTASLPMVIRAVGPTLASAFGISSALADPMMTINAAGNPTAIATNDNWGGGANMMNAFSAVGAFALPAASKDSAFVAINSGGLAPGGYTVQVTSTDGSSGTVIAEIYDAGDATRTATTPRLINLSTLMAIDPGASLAAGFVLRGSTSRTLLVRGVGPSLAALGVGGVMNDPKLEFFNNDTGAKIGENDNWGGDSQLANVMASVGAFALSGAATKDAVLLVTLPPGAYSARVSDVTGGGGTAIVEIYEVP